LDQELETVAVMAETYYITARLLIHARASLATTTIKRRLPIQNKIKSDDIKSTEQLEKQKKNTKKKQKKKHKKKKKKKKKQKKKG
jgi:hypothetical protein